MTKNTECTRFFSTKQETKVACLIDGERCPNSGAGLWRKGDVHSDEASMLIECKTPTSAKSSFSIKKEWVDKNKEEAFSQRLLNQAIAFSFEPDRELYFVINEDLFKYLVDKLKEEYKVDFD